MNKETKKELRLPLNRGSVRKRWKMTSCYLQTDAQAEPTSPATRSQNFVPEKWFTKS